MTDTVVVAIISLLGTFVGSFGGTQLVKYRIVLFGKLNTASSVTLK